MQSRIFASISLADQALHTAVLDATDLGVEKK